MNQLEKIAVKTQISKLKHLSPNLDNASDIVQYLHASANDKPFDIDEAQKLSSILEEEFYKLEDMRLQTLKLLDALLEN